MRLKKNQYGNSITRSANKSRRDFDLPPLFYYITKNGKGGSRKFNEFLVYFANRQTGSFRLYYSQRKTKETNNQEEVGKERGLIPMANNENPPVSQFKIDTERNESQDLVN